MTTVFNSIYSVRLPPYYPDWMRHFDFLSLQWDDLVGVPAGCLARSFKEKLLLTALLPLVLIAAVFVLGAAVWCAWVGDEPVAADDVVKETR
mgnify:CR=1 FL=1